MPTGTSIGSTQTSLPNAHPSLNALQRKASKVGRTRKKTNELSAKSKKGTILDPRDGVPEEPEHRSRRIRVHLIELLRRDLDRQRRMKSIDKQRIRLCRAGALCSRGLGRLRGRRRGDEHRVPPCLPDHRTRGRSSRALGSHAGREKLPQEIEEEFLVGLGLRYRRGEESEGRSSRHCRGKGVQALNGIQCSSEDPLQVLFKPYFNRTVSSKN